MANVVKSEYTRDGGIAAGCVDVRISSNLGFGSSCMDIDMLSAIFFGNYWSSIYSYCFGPPFIS